MAYQTGIHPLVEIDVVSAANQPMQLFQSEIRRQDVVVHEYQFPTVEPYQLIPLAIGMNAAFFFGNGAPTAVIRATPCDISNSIWRVRVDRIVGEHVIYSFRQFTLDVISGSSADRVDRKIGIFGCVRKYLAGIHGVITAQRLPSDFCVFPAMKSVGWMRFSAPVNFLGNAPSDRTESLFISW